MGPDQTLRGKPRAMLELSAGAQRLLAQAIPQPRKRMEAAEFRAEAIVALVFVLVAVPLALLAGPRPGVSVGTVVMFGVLYAVTSQVKFDVGAGYGAPTQLVLVPMLFVLPAGWVPLVVAAAGILSCLQYYLSGARHPDRVIVGLANAWYAVGPALVFTVAGVGRPHWSDWMVYLLALASQLLCDVLASLTRDGLRLGEYPRLTLRLLGPVYLTDVCLTPIGLVFAFAAVARPATVLLTLPLSGLLMFFARDRHARMETAVELSRAYRGTALLLGDVVGADDAYTGSHSRDVVELCMAVGPTLGLDEDQLRRLEFAALLHDVGKISIPKEIINKPAALTPEERAIIETHTVEGEKMLHSVGGLLGEVGTIVRSCHERPDGRGYPDALVADAIPVEARIVACCDAFNAMTTDRPYRGALPVHEALEELRANRGTQFDASVVDALLALHPAVTPPAVTPPAVTADASAALAV